MLGNLDLSLHHWRCFQTKKFSLPSESFLIVDQNGSGKTSLVSAFYSLLTGQPWPLTKFSQNLQLGKEYFGVSTSFESWALMGKINPSGRLSLKYLKPDLLMDTQIVNFFVGGWPKVLTYLPIDNYWLNQERSKKLSLLDTLLSAVYGSIYIEALSSLDKVLRAKQKLIKHCLETEQFGDLTLITTLSEQILEYSLIVWKFRRRFWQLLQLELPEFQSWIENKFTSLVIKWELSNLNGNKDTLNFSKEELVLNMGSVSNNAILYEVLEGKFPMDELLKLGELETPLKNSLDGAEPKKLVIDWLRLWQKELLVGKVLFGAQRDDFRLEVDHMSVENLFSRGEMRLLVLFIKNLGRQQILDGPVWWLLDDIFNELDSSRELLFYERVLKSADYFIATCTKPIQIQAPSYDLKQLTIA